MNPSERSSWRRTNTRHLLSVRYRTTLSAYYHLFKKRKKIEKERAMDRVFQCRYVDKARSFLFFVLLRPF